MLKRAKVAHGPRTFLLSVKPWEGKGKEKEVLAKDLLHMFRDVQMSSRPVKIGNTTLKSWMLEGLRSCVKLCHGVLSRMEKSFLKQVSGDFWENWLTH